MIGAVAAPAVPAAALFAAALLTVAVAILLILMRFVTITLVGSMLRWIGRQLSHLWFVGGWVEGQIESGVRYVDDALSNAISASSHLAVGFFQDGWKLTKWIGNTIADLAAETLHGFQTIVTHTVPAMIAERLHPLQVLLRGLEARVVGIERDALSNIRDGIDRLRARGDEILRSAEASAAAAASAVAGTLRGEIGDVAGTARRELGDVRDRLGRRIGTLERAVGIGALTGVVVSIVARELPWVRCRNVGKVGKALCGMPMDGRLDDLLAGALLISGTVSIVELSKELQGITDDVAEGVRWLVRAG